MRNEDAFVFIPQRTARAAEQISDWEQRLSANRDERELLTYFAGRSSRPKADLLAQLMIYASTQEADSLPRKQAAALWYRNGSVAALLRVYRDWQEHYDSAQLTEFCLTLCEMLPLRADWLDSWKHWLNSDAPDKAAALELAAKPEQPLRELFREKLIAECSSFGKRVAVLSYCFDRLETFSDDEALCAAVEQMQQSEREKLLRLMLRRYPLIARDGTIFPEHAPYTYDFLDTVTQLAETLPENPYARLIGNIVFASDISDEQASQFWEFDYFAALPAEQRLAVEYVAFENSTVFLAGCDLHLIADDSGKQKLLLFCSEETTQAFAEQTFEQPEQIMTMQADFVFEGADRYEQLKKFIAREQKGISEI